MLPDRDLRFEVLTAILGKPVKPKDELPSKISGQLLTLDDFKIASLYLSEIDRSRRVSVSHEEFFIDEDELFDPQYDFDFTNFTTSSTCIRGDEPYEHPCGWYRMALKVKNKYPDGNTWLGTDGWRSRSVSGEWPVSYHGTSLGGAKGIIRDHYKPGGSATYGRGIYSTPILHSANCFTKTFKSEKTGKTYKVIMQNRINPNERKICVSGYWLIPVPQGTGAEEERKIVERSIRPYGILIKVV